MPGATFSFGLTVGPAPREAIRVLLAAVGAPPPPSLVQR